jgi:hypothetical protein
MVLGASEPH